MEVSGMALTPRDIHNKEFQTKFRGFDQEEVVDDEGNVVTPRVTHTEQRLITAAGDRYGIRYEELLMLECARLRREIASLKAVLKNKILI